MVDHTLILHLYIFYINLSSRTDCNEFIFVKETDDPLLLQFFQLLQELTIFIEKRNA